MGSQGTCYTRVLCTPLAIQTPRAAPKKALYLTCLWGPWSPQRGPPKLEEGSGSLQAYSP